MAYRDGSHTVDGLRIYPARVSTHVRLVLASPDLAARVARDLSLLEGCEAHASESEVRVSGSHEILDHVIGMFAPTRSRAVAAVTDCGDSVTIET